jgi:hypothetical protein
MEGNVTWRWHKHRTGSRLHSRKPSLLTLFHHPATLCHPPLHCINMYDDTREKDFASLGNQSITPAKRWMPLACQHSRHQQTTIDHQQCNNNDVDVLTGWRSQHC